MRIVIQTLFNLFVDVTKVYFSIQTEMYFRGGNNEYGELSLGHNTNQNKLNKLPNIPLITVISCVSASCFLIDFEGNLWTC